MTTAPIDPDRILADRYGLRGKCAPLPGERDINVAVRTDDGQRCVLKIMHLGCAAELVDLQCQALAHLARRDEALPLPRVIPDLDGRPFGPVPLEGGDRLVWMTRYVAGATMASLPFIEPGVLVEFGAVLGRLARALEGFEHPAARRSLQWNLTEAAQHIGDCDAIDAPLADMAQATLAHFEEEVLPLLARLPCQVIHNDANDHNALVRVKNMRARFAGLIDFGDMAWQPAVCELAIACAYAALNAPDPLGACAHVVHGYAGERPLSTGEVDVLLPLIKTRLAVSLAVSTRRQNERPGEPYLAVSHAAAASLLPRLVALPPTLARIRLRLAAGLPGLSRAARIARFIDSANAVPALNTGGADTLVLDLGVGSTLLGADPANGQGAALARRIDTAMRRAGASIAVGRYREARLLYQNASFGAAGHPCDPCRTVHLGLDVFCPAGSWVRAPLSGVVHRVANNDQPLDYGPMVIVRHDLPDGERFFTLYGHLQLASVQALRVGQPLAAGDNFVRVGAPPENGDWPPHLHLQVIIDELGMGTDFPGVCAPDEVEAWSQLSPNPASLLGLGEHSARVDGHTAPAKLKARRDRILGGSLSLSYRRPLHVVRGFAQYLYDDKARAYLDMYNNVAHVGHCHPHVVEGVQQQFALLNTNTRYLHENIVKYSERLTAYLPDPLSVCFFVNSASEANELALRLARCATGRHDMVVVEGAYHGHTSSLIDMSPYKYAGPGGAGRPDWVHEVPVADDYRGAFRRDDPDAGRKYARTVEQVLVQLAPPHQAAAFIAETLPSVGGQLILPPGYLKAVYAAVRAHGGLCIADEVQTGFGRLGDAFWGFSDQGVVPDIVVLGKPIANGFPMGAVVTTPAIARAFDNGMEFFATFGGNPVACAAAGAVLDVLEREALARRAAELGRQFLHDLAALAERHAVIGDVRGKGFFLGIELVHDRDTLAPAADVADFVVNRLRDRQVLAGVDGPLHNVIKLRPTLVSTAADLDRVVTLLDDILHEAGILMRLADHEQPLS